MTEREALKLALEALEDLMYWDNGKPEFHEASKRIIAIKEALAQPEQEPVEYQIKILGERWTHCAKHIYDPNNPNTRALYTTPPQPEQEPVATVTSETGADIKMSWWHEPALPVGTPLYTTPPQRTWVGLTQTEVVDLLCEYNKLTGNVGWQQLIYITEAKLKEKNT